MGDFEEVGDLRRGSEEIVRLGLALRARRLVWLMGSDG